MKRYRLIRTKNTHFCDCSDTEHNNGVSLLPPPRSRSCNYQLFWPVQWWWWSWVNSIPRIHTNRVELEENPSIGAMERNVVGNLESIMGQCINSLVLQHWECHPSYISSDSQSTHYCECNWKTHACRLYRDWEDNYQMIHQQHRSLDWVGLKTGIKW